MNLTLFLSTLTYILLVSQYIKGKSSITQLIKVLKLKNKEWSTKVAIFKESSQLYM